MNELTNEVDQQQSDQQTIPESLPNSKYKIQIALGPHATAKDADLLVTPMSSCDVYIPEFALWKEESLEAWNSVASGTISPKTMTARHGDKNFILYQERVLELLHKSGKKVALIDIPAGHPLEKEREELDRKYNSLPVDLPSFDEVLDAREEFYRLDADWIRRREDYMISQLPLVLTQITEDDPEIGRKEAINVLLSLGSTHVRVLHKLRELGYNVQDPIFPPQGEVFDWNHEAVRMGIFNRQFDRTVIARSLIERMVRKQVGNQYGGDFRTLTQDPTKILLLMRKLLGDFSYEDCEAIWQQRKDRFGIYYPFRSMFMSKGLVSPRNEEELDAMLK